MGLFSGLLRNQAQKMRYEQMMGDFRQQYGDDPRLQHFQNMMQMGRPDLASQFFAEAMAPQQQQQGPQFGIVDNPLGRGGKGQIELATGKMVNYYARPKEDTPAAFKSFYNPKTGEEKSARQGSPDAQRLVEQGYIPGRKPAKLVDVNVEAPVSEYASKVNQIKKLRAEGTPESIYAADIMEMKMIHGEKPAENYIKARGNIQQARDSITNMYNMFMSNQANPISPRNRARLAQEFNSAKLAFADLTNRGANFTEQEVAMVDSVLGGDPNKVIARILRGDASYLEGLKNAAQIIEMRGEELVNSYTKPRAGDHVYPWQVEVGQMTATPSGGTDYSKMSNEMLNAVNLDTLSAQELEAWIAEENRRFGGG